MLTSTEIGSLSLVLSSYFRLPYIFYTPLVRSQFELKSNRLQTDKKIAKIDKNGSKNILKKLQTHEFIS